jgi:hypothetical protein
MVEYTEIEKADPEIEENVIDDIRTANACG